MVLTRQFRMPTYVNGNEDGMLIEACAGLLDEDGPEECIRRETEEETGFRVVHVVHIGAAYMSPGSVTEKVHFFVAEYTKEMQVHAGGGLDREEENIEVLELPFARALEMIESGEIQDTKTILLLRHAERYGLLAPRGPALARARGRALPVGHGRRPGEDRGEPRAHEPDGARGVSPRAPARGRRVVRPAPHGGRGIEGAGRPCLPRDLPPVGDASPGALRRGAAHRRAFRGGGRDRGGGPPPGQGGLHGSRQLPACL